MHLLMYCSKSGSCHMYCICAKNLSDAVDMVLLIVLICVLQQLRARDAYILELSQLSKRDISFHRLLPLLISIAADKSTANIRTFLIVYQSILVLLSSQVRYNCHSSIACKFGTYATPFEDFSLSILRLNGWYEYSLLE